MAERRSVSIELLGHEYRIRTEADPDGVERLARLVDDTMARIRQQTGTVDSLDLAVMAALNLANDVLAAQARERDAQRNARVPEAIVPLCEELEAALRETAPAAG